MESMNHLQKEYGTQRPFTVPENYFSELSSRVMAQIPAEEQNEKIVTMQPHHASLRYLRPLVAAAMTIGIVLIAFLTFHNFDASKGKDVDVRNGVAEHSRSQSTSSGDDFDRAADYFMIDEGDMYASLASE